MKVRSQSQSGHLRLFILLLISGLSLTLIPSLGWGKPQGTPETIFDIGVEPKPADWRHFHSMAQVQRRNLWRQHAQQGRTLKDWSWGWRLGWVRACTLNGERYCHKILEEALFDKAMVVRAQAAGALGEKYERTGNAAAIALLDRAYQNPRNERNQKSLFVQYRILHAIHQIGGQSARDVGQRLAKSRPDATTYWNNIAKI